MQIWPFLGVTRVLHASAWRGGSGGACGGGREGGRAGTRGEGVRVVGQRGGGPTGEGQCKCVGPCSCP